jgi:hypothetical protein
MLKTNKRNSHSPPFAHERLTKAGRINRVWSRTVPVGPIVDREKFAYRVLDQELIKAAFCALGNSARLRTDQGFETISIHAPQLHKRNLKGGIFARHSNCYWLVERPKHRGHMSRLEAAAISGNEADFLSSLQDVDWQTKSENDYARIVNFALQAGAHLAAREIAAAGAKLYPNDPQLQKQAEILAPPKIIRRTAVVRPTHRANRDWLKANGETYKGQWVALSEGQLLGTANSLDRLVQSVRRERGVLFTLV